jgi:hypothetical protein
VLECPEARATIHKQRLTCNEAGRFTRKKRDRRSNLAWLRESPYWHSPQIAGLTFTALRIIGAK